MMFDNTATIKLSIREAKAALEMSKEVSNTIQKLDHIANCFWYLRRTNHLLIMHEPKQ